MLGSVETNRLSLLVSDVNLNSLDGVLNGFGQALRDSLDLPASLTESDD